MGRKIKFIVKMIIGLWAIVFSFVVEFVYSGDMILKAISVLGLFYVGFLYLMWGLFGYPIDTDKENEDVQ